MWKPVILVLGILASFSNCMPESGLQELRTQVLNERYTAKWQANFGEKTIEIWIECKTTGYVGFGLSQSGSMEGADLVIGGVDPNGTYFQDYHGTGNTMPVLDEEQNWEAVNITEKGEFTYMHLRRKLDTCDSNGHDLPITDGTVKILWSIGKDDNLEHHAERGVLSINMLDPPLPPTDLSKFDSYNMTKTIIMDGTIDTIYWCSMFKRDSTNKSHIVAFQPKFDTPEAHKYTHHFNVYTCKAKKGMDADATFGKYVDLPGQNCLVDQGGLATVRYMCYQNLYAWSKGGRILVFPENIGIPWGYEETEYFFMEVHLDNQAKDAVTVDTGLTIYYTSELRDIEGGLLSIGHGTQPSLLIPPATKDWTLAGHCSPACTEHGIIDEGINMFNLNLHAHMSGRKMRMRIFRNGTELPWPAKDDTYDFDYQENRPLTNPIKIFKGDHITFECTFDSNWKSPPQTTIGGASSFYEMCMVFVFYYPRTPLEACFSNYPDDKVMSRFGITKYDWPDGTDDPIIIEPAIWENRTFLDILDNEYKWNDTNKAELQKELLYGMHESSCFSRDDVENKAASFYGGLFPKPFMTTRGKNWNLKLNKDDEEITYPIIDHDYVEEDLCDGVNEIDTTTPSAGSTFYLNLNMAIAAIFTLMNHRKP